MGINSVLVLVDSANRDRLEYEPGRVVAELVSAAKEYPTPDWALNLEGEGSMVQECLNIHLGRVDADAVDGATSGRIVGGPRPYGPPRYIAPEAVETILTRLHALPPHPFPTPDPGGYAPDPRIAADEKFEKLAEYLNLYGADTDSPEQMEQLHGHIRDLTRLYTMAKARGDGLLATQC